MYQDHLAYLEDPVAQDRQERLVLVDAQDKLEFQDFQEALDKQELLVETAFQEALDQLVLRGVLVILEVQEYQVTEVLQA